MMARTDDKREDVLSDRRDFIITAARTVGISLCAFALAPLMQSCEVDVVKPGTSNTTGEKFTLLLADAPELQQAGGAIKRTFDANNGGSPVIVIRLDDTSFVAFSAVCTHQGAILNVPRKGSSVMVCPRHEEQYSTTSGQPLTGTAHSGLKQYAVSYDAASESITITF